MERFENNAASVNDDRELSIIELTEITGIARKTAEAMYEIGIQSYADLIEYLSQHTTEEVSAALKEQGVNRGPGLVDKETWISQAELLLRNQENTTPKTSEEAEHKERPEKAASIREAREHDFVFSVSFDVMREEDGEPRLITTVYDERNAGQEEEFKGSDPSQWVNWILERAQLPVANEYITSQVEVSEEPPPTKTEEIVPTDYEEQFNVQLEIGDVQLSVIEPTLELPEKRIKAEIDFKLSGPDAEMLTLRGIPFQTEIYTIDVDSGFPRNVASREDQIESRVFEYTDQLEFAIPIVGRYEVHSIVRLLPPSELMAYHRGPKMNVIPRPKNET